MIIFDSRNNEMKNQGIVFSNKCKIVKYNSFFRLQYYALDLVIGNFEIVKLHKGVYLYLYDIHGHNNGVIEVKEGGWEY